MGEHWEDLSEGEPAFEMVYCGAPSEGQWRKELRAVGVMTSRPATGDLKLGIQRVYSELKNGRLVFFDDMTATLDQIVRYRHKRDRTGTVLKDIEGKATYHYLDALRYPVCSIRPTDRMKTKVVRLG